MRDYLYVRDTLLPRARERLAYWTARRGEAEAEITRERPEIRRLEEQIRRKVIVPPVVPKPLIGVVDSKTGYKIMMLDAPLEIIKEGKTLAGTVWLYDEEKMEYIKPAENVEVQFTATVETSGHEDVLAELTGWTIVYGEELDGKHAIKDIVDSLIVKVEDWFYKKFAPPPEGEAFFGGPIPKKAIKPDFKIQEREKRAKHEGTIQQWEMVLLEGWREKLPRIIKKGIGFYSTSETDPHWTVARVFCEWGHEEESVKTHSLPEELI
jgi:hypothetical protein